MKQTLGTALARKGYDQLTPVQEAVTAAELAGRDMLVSAQTGSGKTIGFGLAIAESLLGEDGVFPDADAPLALIIAPTRELALQVKRELGWLYADAGARFASCVGGMDFRDERRALQRGAHVVVGTPGRLADHLRRGTIDLGLIKAVVLDEADEMLDLGFREDLEFILGETPEARQTLLFSATVPQAITKLAARFQKDAERISTISGKGQHSDISYRAMLTVPRDVENAVINVLRYYEAPNAIVFCNTRAAVGRLTSRLSNRGLSVVALSGELTQSERSNAMQAMRDGRARICVATDVAARGIDLPGLDLVVHAELPGSPETLLHRSGRTGRAGRKGVSALIVPASGRKKAERILKFAKLDAEWCAAPSAEEVIAQDHARLMEADYWQDEITETETGMIAELQAKFTAEQITAAFLRLHQTRHAPPEDVSEVSLDAPKPRAAFGASVWFSLSGRWQKQPTARLALPIICKAGGLGRDDIGAIRFAGDTCHFEVREEAVPGFRQAVGEEMTIEGTLYLEETGVAPDLPARGPKKPRHKRNDARPRKPRPAPAGKRESVSEPTQKPSKPPKRADEPAKTKVKGGEAVKQPKQKPPKSSKRPEQPAQAKGGETATGRAPHKPKGPPPPKGKPNSKKNKMRRAKKAAETRKGARKG